MNSSPETRAPTLRSSTNRILRARTDVVSKPVDILQVDALPYGSDGRPITAEVRAATDEASKQGWERGWSDGHARGLAEGRDQAYRQFCDVLSPTVTTMEHMLEQIRRVDGASTDALVDQVLDLAVSVAEAIIAHEIESMDQPALQAVRRALTLAPDRGDVLARVHPDDVNILDAVSALLPGRSVHLIADGSVERGGAVVQIGPCRVDAQIAPALARVRETLGLNR